MNLQEAISAYKLGEYDKALEIFVPMAEQGDPRAQAYLGEMCRYGTGVEEDTVEAVEWFRKAAEQGYGMAQHNLGLIYFEGEGVQQDYVEAAEWFRKAIEGGYEGSFYQLGRMYSEGLGVRQDDDTATRLFWKGAELGVSGCIASLADLYKKGIELQDEECALAKEILKVAAGDDAELQRYLGLKEYGYRVYFNKMTIFIVLGLLTMASLAVFDWTIITNQVMGPEQGVGWFTLVFVGLLGLDIGGLLSRVPYRLDTYSRVSGIPFPATIWQPSTINRDHWLCFHGLLTMVSALLNACYFSLIAVAILFIISAEYSRHFLIFLLVVAGSKRAVEIWNK